MAPRGWQGRGRTVVWGAARRECADRGVFVRGRGAGQGGAGRCGAGRCGAGREWAAERIQCTKLYTRATTLHARDACQRARARGAWRGAWAAAAAECAAAPRQKGLQRQPRRAGAAAEAVRVSEPSRLVPRRLACRARATMAVTGARARAAAGPALPRPPPPFKTRTGAYGAGAGAQGRGSARVPRLDRWRGCESSFRPTLRP
jgi:hypothetical protein